MQVAFQCSSVFNLSVFIHSITVINLIAPDVTSVTTVSFTFLRGTTTLRITSDEDTLRYLFINER